MTSHTAIPTQDDSLVREELLQSCYTDWKQRYDNKLMPELKKHYVYSPSWERLWDHAWAEYDGLERIRTARGFMKQNWQDIVDEDRRQREGMRKRKSKSGSLTAYDWTQVSLGMILERYLGTNIGPGKSDAAVAIGRWRRFRKVMAEQPEFQRSLSVSQRVSFTILTHWWSGTYQDPSLSKAAIVSLEAAASSSAPMIYVCGEYYPDRATFARLRRSVYNSIMYVLFLQEFNPYEWEPYCKEIPLTTLRVTRLKSVQHATAQRIGYTSYMNLKGLSTYSAGPYLSSVDKPCPWLRREGDDKEMPYFLWDVEKGRTVMVSELEAEPEYFCVSHTWGRWRKEAISIDGVPWPVPQNERFEVERLPEYLQQIQPQTHFIWIDLFCIPQDGSPKADDEINRQASIFQNSSGCIAWINDARGWERTTTAFDWLGISYLHATTCAGIYDTDSLLQSLRHEAKATSELFASRYVLGDTESPLPANLLDKSGRRTLVSINHETLAEPVCWFSSLWTLQEAMLCPDITFVARDWTRLNDRHGIPIPLDAFLSLIDTVQSLWHNEKPYQVWTEGAITRYSKYRISSDENQYLRWPDGPRQLHEFCIITRMDNLLESPSPAGLLFVANVRQCTGSRAPAIMSALGITDWYKAREKADTELVLKSYPLAFVKEAALKLGGSFYQSVTSRQKIPKRYNLFNRSHKGSMMPFSATSGWFSRIVAMPVSYDYTPDDHPAVKTWTIRQDGSVDIKQVGIVASTEISDPDEVPMLIHVMKTGSRAHDCRFGDWAKGLPKGVCMYAISLLRDLGRQHGLILQGYRKTWFSSHRLVKIGTFVTTQIELPPTTNVDWVAW